MDSYPHKLVGQKIKQLRQASGLSQQAVATKADVAYSTLAKLEQGTTRAPSIAVLYKLAQVLEFNIDDLLADKPLTRPIRSPIRFVYSDIGGVLIHTEHSLLQPLSMVLNRPLEQVKALYYLYVPMACRGQLSLHEMQLLFLLKLNIKYRASQKKRIFQHWVDYMEPITETQGFLKQIAQNYPVGLLTDTFMGFVERMDQQKLLPKLNYKAIVKSCDVGILKPDAKIFEIATKKAGVRPEEIFFIDDKQVNVKGARDFGWQAEWFNELKPAASIARIRRKYFST